MTPKRETRSLTRITDSNAISGKHTEPSRLGFSFSTQEHRTSMPDETKPVLCYWSQNWDFAVNIHVSHHSDHIFHLLLYFNRLMIMQPLPSSLFKEISDDRSLISIYLLSGFQLLLTVYRKAETVDSTAFLIRSRVGEKSIQIGQAWIIPPLSFGKLAIGHSLVMISEFW
jgi:hypothetical protein